MKVYVDELPECCDECPMCRSGKLKLQRKGRYVEAEQCVFGQYKYQTIDDEIDTCPLQSLTDYTKQVRKEVCEEFREQICILAYKSNSDENFMFNDNVKFNKVLEILDQIQGETK